MELINILIMLAIIYSVFLIIDKFTGYIIAILMAVIIGLSLPYIFKGIVLAFSWFMNIMTTPIYWITGYKLVLSWWVGLIIFVTAFIPFLISGWGFQRESPML